MRTSRTSLIKAYYRPIEAAIRWSGLHRSENSILQHLGDRLKPELEDFPCWPGLYLNSERIYNAMANRVEIDLDAQVWTIPAERMKVPKEHRIPLCPQAIKLLRPLVQDETSDSEYLFPSNKPGTHLSNTALLQLLRRLERSDIIAHGFRSTFRDWANETTDYPREVAEAALAHTIRNKTEAAYARGDLFDKRRVMMTHWGRYLSQIPR